MVFNGKHTFWYMIPKVCLPLHLTGIRWTSINRRYCIETGLTVPQLLLPSANLYESFPKQQTIVHTSLLRVTI